MKRNVIVISLIVSYLMVIVHGMIPHHHHNMDDIELFSYQHSIYHQDNNTETDNSHHFPFPVHHHVSVSGELDIARPGTGLERDYNISVSCCFLMPIYLSCIPESGSLENTFYSVIKIPLNSQPFILSPNAMRGSPSVI